MHDSGFCCAFLVRERRGSPPLKEESAFFHLRVQVQMGTKKKLNEMYNLPFQHFTIVISCQLQIYMSDRKYAKRELVLSIDLTEDLERVEFPYRSFIYT